MDRDTTITQPLSLSSFNVNLLAHRNRNLEHCVTALLRFKFDEATQLSDELLGDVEA